MAPIPRHQYRQRLGDPRTTRNSLSSHYFPGSLPAQAALARAQHNDRRLRYSTPVLAMQWGTTTAGIIGEPTQSENLGHDVIEADERECVSNSSNAQNSSNASDAPNAPLSPDTSNLAQLGSPASTKGTSVVIDLTDDEGLPDAWDPSSAENVDNAGPSSQAEEFSNAFKAVFAPGPARQVMTTAGGTWRGFKVPPKLADLATEAHAALNAPLIAPPPIPSAAAFTAKVATTPQVNPEATYASHPPAVLDPVPDYPSPFPSLVSSVPRASESMSCSSATSNSASVISPIRNSASTPGTLVEDLPDTGASSIPALMVSSSSTAHLQRLPGAISAPTAALVINAASIPSKGSSQSHSLLPTEIAHIVPHSPAGSTSRAALTAHHINTLTSHFRTVRILTGTRPTPSSMQEWFASKYPGLNLSAETIIKVLRDYERSSDGIHKDVAEAMWKWIIHEVEEKGKRPVMREIQVWVRKHGGGLHPWPVLRGVINECQVKEKKRLSELWGEDEEFSDNDIEGVDSDEGEVDEEDKLPPGAGKWQNYMIIPEILIPMRPDMVAQLNQVNEAKAGKETEVLQRISEGLTAWCRAVGEGMISERALKVKARIMMENESPDQTFPPGWLKEWRRSKGIRTLEDMRDTYKFVSMTPAAEAFQRPASPAARERSFSPPPPMAPPPRPTITRNLRLVGIPSSHYPEAITEPVPVIAGVPAVPVVAEPPDAAVAPMGPPSRRLTLAQRRGLLPPESAQSPGASRLHSSMADTIVIEDDDEVKKKNPGDDKELPIFLD